MEFRQLQQLTTGWTWLCEDNRSNTQIRQIILKSNDAICSNRKIISPEYLKVLQLKAIFNKFIKLPNQSEQLKSVRKNWECQKNVSTRETTRATTLTISWLLVYLTEVKHIAAVVAVSEFTKRMTHFVTRVSSEWDIFTSPKFQISILTFFSLPGKAKTTIQREFLVNCNRRAQKKPSLLN